MVTATDLAWGHLHDAALVGIDVDWDSGEVTVRLRVPHHERARITARAARLLECPREQPWGPSASVNEVRRIAHGAEPTSRLEIEMQSGDMIVIVAAIFELADDQATA